MLFSLLSRSGRQASHPTAPLRCPSCLETPSCSLLCASRWCCFRGSGTPEASNLSRIAGSIAAALPDADAIASATATLSFAHASATMNSTRWVEMLSAEGLDVLKVLYTGSLSTDHASRSCVDERAIETAISGLRFIVQAASLIVRRNAAQAFTPASPPPQQEPNTGIESIFTPLASPIPIAAISNPTRCQALAAATDARAQALLRVARTPGISSPAPEDLARVLRIRCGGCELALGPTVSSYKESSIIVAVVISGALYDSFGRPPQQRAIKIKILEPFCFDEARTELRVLRGPLARHAGFPRVFLPAPAEQPIDNASRSMQPPSSGAAAAPSVSAAAPSVSATNAPEHDELIFVSPWSAVNPTWPTEGIREQLLSVPGTCRATLPMTLLGHAVSKLSRCSEAWPTPRATLLRFTDQALQRLASMQSVGLVHGNIKPGNFCVAMREDVAAGEPQIFLIDLATASTIGYRRRSQACRSFYASSRALRECYYAARDDIEALAYCVADLVGGRDLLPWARSDLESMLEAKRNCVAEALFAKLGGADAGICEMLVRAARNSAVFGAKLGDAGYANLRQTLVSLAFAAGPEVAAEAGATSPEATCLEYSSHGPAGAWRWVPEAPRRREGDPVAYTRTAAAQEVERKQHAETHEINTSVAVCTTIAASCSYTSCGAFKGSACDRLARKLAEVDEVAKTLAPARRRSMPGRSAGAGMDTEPPQSAPRYTGPPSAAPRAAVLPIGPRAQALQVADPRDSCLPATGSPAIHSTVAGLCAGGPPTAVPQASGAPICGPRARSKSF